MKNEKNKNRAAWQHARATCSMAAALGLALSVLGLFGLAADPANHDRKSDPVDNAVETFKEGIAADNKALDGLVDIVQLNPIIVKKDPAPKQDTQKTAAQNNAARIQEEAQQQIQWARQQLQLAQAAADRAAKAPNAAEKQVELRTAFDLAKQANNWKRRAEAALQSASQATTGSSTGTAAGSGASLPNLFRFESPTFHVLKQINATEGGKPLLVDEPAKRKHGFDTASQPDAQFADPVGYDPESGMLVTRGGRHINVKPLVEAGRQMIPNLSAKDLFVPVDTPAGGYQLNPQLQKELSTPAAQEKLQTIGGVALDATLNLLSYNGVPGFRKLGPATVIEAPMLISLGALYKKLQPFDKNWDKLPDELRHPAELERVHGFVLDPAHQDVFLVGTRARRPQDRMDVDCLILALRSTWRDGSVPAISLDPVPPRWAGPQYSAIYDIPADSICAKIMLDADYAMKKIMCGVSDASLPGFIALCRKEAEETLATVKPGTHQFWPSRSRFWLVPAPLAAGDIHLSSSYRTMLFDSRVLCRTEALALNGNQPGTPWRGTGEKSAWAARSTDLFNASYEELESSSLSQPAGIFLHLHGLTDLVITAKLLREFAVNYPVLEQFAALQIRKLPANEAAPPFYPGVHVEYAVGRGVCAASGGALLRVRALRSALDLYNDVTTARLEQAVDHFPRQTKFFIPLNISFTLPRPRADAGQHDRMDKIFDQAAVALARGEFEQARDGFEEVMREEANYGDAWVGLAAAYDALGDHAAAMRAMTSAMQSELTSYEPLYVKQELVGKVSEQLRNKADGRLALHRLSERLTQIAVSELSQNHRQEANHYAWMATAAEDQPLAYLVLSLCESDNADFYRQHALGVLRARAAEDVTSQRQLAFGLILEAVARMKAVQEQMSSYVAAGKSSIDDPDEGKAMAEECEAVDAILREAQKLAPDRGDIAASEIAARSVATFVEIARGHLPDLKDSLTVAQNVVKQFPNLAAAHFAFAYLQWAQMQIEVRRNALPGLPKVIVDSILAEMTEALRLDPTYGDVYLMRGVMYAAIGEKEKAQADQEQCEQLQHSFALRE